MKIHQIKLDFYVTDAIKRYVYIYIVEGEQCYLIDSGVAGSETIIEQYLHSINRSVEELKGIFLTHAHPDHIGTAAYFQEKTGCDIYASRREKRWIENIDLEYEERPIPNFYRLAGKSAKVTRTVKDGDIITLEKNVEVQVVGTPGHSIDELSFVIGENAFIGDSIPVKGDIPIYTNKVKTLNSMNKITQLPSVTTFYPAWDTVYNKSEVIEKVKSATELIHRIDECVKAVYAEDKNVGEEKMCQKVCEKLQMPFLFLNPLFKTTVKSHCIKEFTTVRLVLRPWEDTDAESLFEYAKDPAVGPAAGWPVHTSVENSLQIIRGVLAEDNTYAVCLREDNRAIGSAGLFPPTQSQIKECKLEMEIGYWIGVPFWGNGYIPEAVRELQRYAFEELGCTALWCSYYDGNEKSRRCMEKCGFRYHHTEENKVCSLIGEVRTEHYNYLTKEQWELLR